MAPATLISFPTHEDGNGILGVYECGEHVPFDIHRVFTISASAGDIRGDHAHKKCTQLLVCISGKIHVTCDDGSAVDRYVLDNMGDGLLIPPGIWAKQEYLVDGAVLMVLCDHVYEADDYVRDYNDFRKFIALKESV